MDLLWGHETVSQHRIRSRQVDTGSLVRSTRTRRRYTRAAYTLHEHASRSSAAAAAADSLAESVSRPRRVTFVHTMARLTPDQRLAIQLRYLDGYPRDAAAALMSRSIDAVRGLGRRAIARMHAILVGAAESTARSQATGVVTA